MKIKSVTISNILSFPFIEDIDNSPATIVFDSRANVLIGPNGSGKSNFIEIISKILQSYFIREFAFDENAMALLSVNQKPIKIEGNRKAGATNDLPKHEDYEDKISKVKFSLSFDKNDIANLNFVLENFDELVKLGLEYIQNGQIFKQGKFKINKFEKSFDVPFYFTFVNSRTHMGGIQLEWDNLTDEEKFVHDYLENFNLLQKLIEIGNTVKGKPWKDLKQTVALIGSLRLHNGFIDQIGIVPGSGNALNNMHQESAFNQTTKKAMQSETVFQIAFRKLGQHIKLNRDTSGKPLNDFLIELQHTEGSLIKRINNALAEIDLEISLGNFEPYSETIPINIFNTKGKIVRFNDLSTGQKSIFHLIFSVYGFDLENGLLIIDEPELHLHTSMQKKYFQILKNIAEPFNLQIILATHSPIFIDEGTIQNTFRFSKPENSTIITRPNNQIGQTQKDLLQFLTYTNSSRVFFSDIVILVEGSSDEYFFKYFYDNYYLTKNQTKATIEFLNIGGKSNRKKWKDFLDLFNIKNAFIGDFDNIQNEGVAGLAGVNYQELIDSIKQYAITEVNKKISEAGNSSKDGIALFENLDNIIQKDFVINEDEKRNLSNLWNYLLERCGISGGNLFKFLSDPENTAIFQKIRQAIVKKYSEDIYILQQGDLESYLGISKDMNNVINFCANSFGEWIKTEEAKAADISKLTELVNIIDSIVK